MPKVSSIRFGDLIPLAWSALTRNKLRSSLTVGAIAFGVSVMVYLVSLGLGLENLTVGSVLRSSTLLSFTVNTFNPEVKPLNGEAVTEIESLPEVAQVLPKLSLKGEVVLGAKTAPVTVVGVDSDYFALTDNSPLLVGRSFVEGETNSMLVSTSFLQLFGLNNEKTPLITFDLQLDPEYGDVERIKDINVRGIISDDAAIAIYLPRAYLESIMTEQPDYQDLKILVNDLSQIEPASASVIGRGYKVSTVVDTVDEIKRVFSYIQITMAVLGGIAIVVASIGMFNTLTVSLLERTREVGIMKALGIKRQDVRRLFLMEALLIGVLGGVVGVVLALVLQQITIFVFQVLALIAQGSVPRLFINYWYLPVSSLVFSMLIAALTGIYPANRAAKLNPIDAIRHE